MEKKKKLYRVVLHKYEILYSFIFVGFIGTNDSATAADTSFDNGPTSQRTIFQVHIGRKYM